MIYLPLERPNTFTLHRTSPFFSSSRYRNTGGFDIIGSGRDKIETPEQFKGARDHCAALELDGLVVIGGDDSNTNACLLAENFAAHKCTTRVVGCPKTIDADLKNEYIPVSFGFDTACKVRRPGRPGRPGRLGRPGGCYV